MISGGSGLAVGVGGMRAYYLGMIGAMAEIADGDELVTFTTPRYEAVPLPYGQQLREVVCDHVPAGRFGRAAYEHALLGLKARRQPVDVLLSTHNIRPLSWRGPSVVVLQAMQNFLFKDRARARDAYLKVVMPASLRSADRVIAVSEASRRDAIEVFRLEPGRVVTVHHGCAEWAIAAADEYRRSGVPAPPPPLGGRPYILNVSTLYGLKNHARLVEAFGVMAARSSCMHDLVIAGGDADVTRAELAEIAVRAGVGSRVRLLGRFPQEHIASLYANAAAVAYPSLYETFGLPVLEAYAFERPLLTSNVGGGAEIAGEGAIKVDPRDVEAMADGLQTVIEDEDRRRELVTAGRERLADFSWARCARETLGVVRDVSRSSR